MNRLHEVRDAHLICTTGVLVVLSFRHPLWGVQGPAPPPRRHPHRSSNAKGGANLKLVGPWAIEDKGDSQGRMPSQEV